MKGFLYLLIALLPLGQARAQSETIGLGSARQPVQLTISPVYQQYDLGDMTVSEVTTMLQAAVPLGRHLGMSLQVAHATAGGGEPVPEVSGFTDAQVALSYSRRLGAGSLVAGLGLNLPSGKQELSAVELETLAVLSENVYGFRTPSFGLGWAAAPSLTVAFPVSEGLVLGGGASYLYRSSFTPQVDMEGAYDLGNEVLLTGGLDARLSPSLTFSGDVSYTFYSQDRIGEAVYEPGSKIVIRGQVRHRQGFHEARLAALYRSRAQSTYRRAAGVEDGEGLTTPAQLEVEGRYLRRLSRRVSATFLGKVRVFEDRPVGLEMQGEEVPAVSQLIGGGVAPALHLSRSLRLATSFLYLFGDARGFEGGISLTTRL